MEDPYEKSAFNVYCACGGAVREGKLIRPSFDTVEASFYCIRCRREVKVIYRKEYTKVYDRNGELIFNSKLKDYLTTKEKP